MEFSNRYTVGFVLALCLVCSLLVSTTAVSLSERQERNRLLDRNEQVVRVAGLATPDEELTPEDVQDLFQFIEPVLVDRATGAFVEGDASAYAFARAAKEPETSQPTPAEFAPTQVRRMPDVLAVYLVDAPDKRVVVLPIHGYGLWTTLYGFLALEQDLSAVVGITYYQHGETPGLGGEVDSPAWKQQWVGKVPFDELGALQLEVLKAGVPPSRPSAQVDGLSGATITTLGVHRMIQLWLGPEGYGPLLQRLSQEVGN